MSPVDLCKYGVAHAKQLGCDVVLFDTAGRLAIDNALMGELQQIKADNTPHNIFFVCDSMIGQDSVKTAKSLSNNPISPVYLTNGWDTPWWCRTVD